MKKILCFFVFVSVVFSAGCSTDSTAVTDFLKGSTLLSDSTENIGSKPTTIEQAITETPDTTDETNVEYITAETASPFSTNLSNQQMTEMFSKKGSVDFLVVINLSTKTLTLCVNGYRLCAYEVGPGRLDSNGVSISPVGKFWIINKYIDIPYTGNGSYIPAGSPYNPYGRYWMAFSIQGNAVYGIHGNDDESSIGEYVSGGCIRMHNSDIPVLFDTIPEETPVWIGYEDQLRIWEDELLYQ